MEEEDDVGKSVDVASPSLEQPLSEPQTHTEQPPAGTGQCGVVSDAGDASTSVTTHDEAQPSLVDELGGDNRENEGENVDESKLVTEEDVTVDDAQLSPVVEYRDDLVAEAAAGEVAEREERQNEGEDVEELKAEGEEEVKVKDIAQPLPEVEVQDELAGDGSAAEYLEEENEGEDGQKSKGEGEEEVKVEELASVTEDLEVKNEEVIEKDEEMVGEEREIAARAEEVERDDIAKAKEVPLVVEEMEHLPAVTKEDELMEAEEEVEEEEEETPIADTEMETESETIKSGSGSGGGKRRRGRNAKAAPVRAPSRKTVGEDVCFICLDGGDLVLCDRRGCPKAYHPSCVDHDEEFFKTKGRWNCGWHLCNICGKNAYFMCYTCTFSLCKGCSKDAVIFCVRGNKGFCESCMKTVMVIESSEQKEMGQDAFNDRSSWEYLFKDYWIEQKGKLCITSDELAQAKNPLKNSDKQQASNEVHKGNNDAGADSDSSLGNLEVSGSKRKKAKRKSKSVDYDTDSSLEKYTGSGKRKSKRRLKSQATEAFLDSEQSSQDTPNKRGKRPRRLSKSRCKDVNSAGAANDGTYAEGNVEWASKELLEFVMLMKNGDTSVLTQFDVQGLLLEYIKRNKLRDPRRQSQIICDSMLQKLFGKPRVGHFEMLKLLESHFLLKEDLHADNTQGSVVDTEMSRRDAEDNSDFLLDAGRSRGRKSRKRGEERGLQSNLDDYAAIDMHNINLIFLRRNLMEALMEDSERFHDKVVGSFVRIRISGSSQKQDIYRLVQIIGTSKATEPYKVGKRTTDVMLEILNLDKTEIISIDTISNQEFTEDECKRLRQSIKCGLISRMTVGDVLEKARELQELRVIDWLETEILRLSHLRDRASEKGRKKELRECVEKLQLLKTPEERQRRLDEIPGVHADPKMDPSCESEEENEDTKSQGDMRPRERRGRDHFSSRKGGSVSSDSWSANARPPNKKWELDRNLSGKGFSSRREDTAFTSPTREQSWNNGVDTGTPRSNSWENPRVSSDHLTDKRAEYSGVGSDMSAATVSESPRPQSTVLGQTDSKVSDTEKVWHYRDPTGKVQGPFSIAQLRKWSNTGYFPADLRIWRASKSEDDSILLTEALAGRFQKEVPSVGLNSDAGSQIRNAPSSLDTSKHSGNTRRSEIGGRYDTSGLPSPTPARSPFQSTNQLRGGHERLPSPTPTSPSSDPSGVGRSKFSHQSKGVAGNTVETVAPPAGAMQPSSGQFFSTPGPRTDVPSDSGNTQQIASQSAIHMGNQQFTPPNSVMSQASMQPNVAIAGQGFPNVVQPATAQNSSAYGHGWVSGYVARPEAVNANLTPNNPNAVPAQVAYGQWSGASVNNQAPSYGAGYPPAPGNIATNFQAMPPQNAWRPAPTNMQWGGQQQPVNQNIGWSGQPSGAAFGPSAGAVAGVVGPQAGSIPGASAMPAGTTTMGWSGAGPNPSAGSTNPGWAAQPGNTSGWGGDQSRNGGGPQWGRQSPFGSGGQRVCKFHETGHCKKGASCDYMHN